MKLQILSFSWESFSSDNVISVTLMTSIWEITVLDDHSPLLTSVTPSTMYVIYIDSKWVERRNDFAIWKWVVEISNNSVKVMADMLVDTDEIDTEAAERARENATKLMEKYKDSKDKIDMEKFIEAEDMLLKSIATLKLSDTMK